MLLMNSDGLQLIQHLTQIKSLRITSMSFNENCLRSLPMQLTSLNITVDFSPCSFTRLTQYPFHLAILTLRIQCLDIFCTEVEGLPASLTELCIYSRVQNDQLFMLLPNGMTSLSLFGLKVTNNGLGVYFSYFQDND